MDAADHADGRKVVGRQRRRGPLCKLEQRGNGSQAALYFVVAFDDEAGILMDAVAVEGTQEGLAANLGGSQVRRTGGEGDASMTEGGEVIDGFVDAVFVIHNDVAGGGARFRHIEEHHGDVAARELVDEMVVHFRSHYGDAVDAAFQHAAHATGHFTGVVIG